MGNKTIFRVVMCIIILSTFILPVSAQQPDKTNEYEVSLKKLMEVNPNIKIDTYKIVNNFFGETITVAGLLTGTDIIGQLKGKINSEYLIMPNNMFRKGYELGPAEYIMLDDTKIEDIEKELGVKVLVCDHTGEDIVSIINDVCQEEQE